MYILISPPQTPARHHGDARTPGLLLPQAGPRHQVRGELPRVLEVHQVGREGRRPRPHLPPGPGRVQLRHLAGEQGGGAGGGLLVGGRPLLAGGGQPHLVREVRGEGGDGVDLRTLAEGDLPAEGGVPLLGPGGGPSSPSSWGEDLPSLLGGQEGEEEEAGGEEEGAGGEEGEEDGGEEGQVGEED